MAAQTTDNKPSFSENWKNLQKILAEESEKEVSSRSSSAANHETSDFTIVMNRRKRKHDFNASTAKLDSKNDIWKKRRAEIKEVKSSKENNEKRDAEVTKILGLDCEYVGVGVDGSENMLARVSIVNVDGVPIYDKYVKPTQRITDFRTAFSGIRPYNLTNGLPFSQIQSEVSKLIAGRIVVGHALHNDFKVLNISHPRRLTRDTFKYPLLRQTVNKKFPSLKLLSKELLGVNIQDGEHDSVVDARMALRLYLQYKKKWENDLRKILK